MKESMCVLQLHTNFYSWHFIKQKEMKEKQILGQCHIINRIRHLDYKIKKINWENSLIVFYIYLLGWVLKLIVGTLDTLHF